jgi:kumamolisin
VFGGTSAVAPLYAALVTLINQQIGKSIGFLNPKIYAKAVEASAFHDITVGNNGSFKANAGWDACTGLGSPDGAKLMAAITATVQGKGAAARVGAGSKSGRSKEPAS